MWQKSPSTRQKGAKKCIATVYEEQPADVVQGIPIQRIVMMLFSSE